MKKVHEALIKLGFPSSQISMLDSYDAISIHVENLPDVMFSNADDRLWIWSLLPHLSEARLLDHAKEVMQVITTAIEGVESGQPTFGMGEGGYELKAAINISKMTDADDLLNILRDFIARLHRLCTIFEIKWS
ncbi:hypothetical protein [Burkholderia ubonensis]|uniref:InvB/SpaK family type III secretion system chaperone n=1 Tax=Burkholderia ubonensis TaxID=101571 RepID=UPI0009B41474|nr:hypothetical protein [Burkholderia ubonensis]